VSALAFSMRANRSYDRTLAVRVALRPRTERTVAFDGHVLTPLCNVTFNGHTQGALPRADRWEIAATIAESAWSRLPMVVIRCGWLAARADTPIVWASGGAL
jgi:hypothetical protein